MSRIVRISVADVYNFVCYVNEKSAGCNIANFVDHSSQLCEPKVHLIGILFYG